MARWHGLGVAVLAVLILAGPARALPGLSARELVDLCEAGFPPHPGPAGNVAGNAARRQGCVAYLDAVAATVTQIAALAPENTQVSDNAVMPGPAQKPALFCIPGDEPATKIVSVLRAYLEAHPRDADRVAATVAIAAFGAAYPCR